MTFQRLRKLISVIAFFIALAPASAFVAQTRAPQHAQAVVVPPGRDPNLWQRALRLHRSSIVVDGHNDVTTPMVDEDYDLGTPSVGKYHTDIQRLKQGGITGQFFAIYVDGDFVKSGGSARRALDMIDLVYRAAERHPQDFMMATTAADILRAKREGKIAALMGIEGGHAIENSLMALRDFYRLGVRYMTLTHNNTNDWADSSRDAARHSGLSEFGKEVVKEMNRLGMMVDVSHVSDETMSDALDISTAPIIASHSSARALADHPRNISDDLLRRIAKTRGLVMVNFFPVFIDPKAIQSFAAREERLKPELDALKERYKSDAKGLAGETMKLYAANPITETPLSILIDHIDHIARVAGVDHVGLGSDFDGVPSLPQEMSDVSQLPNITYELLKRGYKEQDIRKILGGNLIRVMTDVERVARAAKGTISGNGSIRRIK
ncbi:MAG: membrane dipeptidase [Pyrinomonadaceae bacterium]